MAKTSLLGDDNMFKSSKLSGVPFYENKCYCLKDAAKILCVSEARLRKLCRDKQIACRMPERGGRGGDRRYFISGWALRDFMEGLPPRTR